MGLIVPIWKRKGDVHDPGKYRGITLRSQVLKLLERVLDARIRRRVEGDFGEEQQGFRKGRGTADGMYVLRQRVEKRLEVQGSMALGFVDLLDCSIFLISFSGWVWESFPTDKVSVAILSRLGGFRLILTGLQC